MSTIFEEAEDEELAHAEIVDGAHDREITLNSMTVLSIFFGLVLICGLCFGVGFTLGRRSSPETAADVFPSAKNGATGVTGTNDSRAKPSASTQGKGVTASSTEDRPASEAEDTTQSAKIKPMLSAAPRDGRVDAGNQADGYVQPAASAKTAMPDSGKSALAAPPIKPGTFMVQIAAVSNPADGAVLVGALSKRGYTVVIRHETTDALQHVQIGPFTSRAEALAMRQKLLADGYNAILKQ